MIPVELAVESGLAAHRITRLITTDVIGDRSRIWAAQKLTGWPAGQDALKCDWCVGVWVGAVVTILDARGATWWHRARHALAVADVVGIIAGTY